MNENGVTALLTPGRSRPESLARAVAPVSLDLISHGEVVQQGRVGPLKAAAEFLDIEGVRMRVALEQGGQSLPGQASLVDRLRALPPEEPLIYVILETATRQAKCYLVAENHQLLGILWLPVAARQDGETSCSGK